MITRSFLITIAACCCVVTVGCRKNQEPKPDDASHFEETAGQQARIVAISELWKKNHEVSDFLLLKDSIQEGTKPEYVRQILGDPISSSSGDDGREFWLYVKANAKEEQYYIWTLIFSPKKTVVGWNKKGIE